MCSVTNTVILYRLDSLPQLWQSLPLWTAAHRVVLEFADLFFFWNFSDICKVGWNVKQATHTHTHTHTTQATAGLEREQCRQSVVCSLIVVFSTLLHPICYWVGGHWRQSSQRYEIEIFGITSLLDYMDSFYLERSDNNMNGSELL